MRSKYNLRKSIVLGLTLLLLLNVMALMAPSTMAARYGMDTDLSTVDASFWGEDAGDHSGISIASAGDVNGDGFDDILIGAVCNGAGGINAGQTYLILGKASGWAMDTDLSTADASFIGTYTGGYSGRSVSGAGDVNGDGYDDILIGAWRNGVAGYESGRTYLIFGKASGWAMDTKLTASNASFHGEDSGDRAGYSVSSAGDVNGDGFDDFLIGAEADEDGGGNAGQTYLILGGASGWAMDTSLSSANASFIGEDSGDYSGRDVSGAGDVNGDGYDDIIIGAYNDEEGGTSAGQAYLILGKASGWAMDTDLSDSNASFLGEGSEDWCGNAVSGAGDVNGDGFDDIIIGAYGSNCRGIYSGQTYLILGKASGWAMDTDLSTADASFWGEVSNDLLGSDISEAGDVNNDGFDDFLIIAEGNDHGGQRAGQAYLILGKASGWTIDTDVSSVDASFWGEDAYDYCGQVAGAGDVNGDGFDDILIGAWGDEDGGKNAGQTYLIFFNIKDSDNDGVSDVNDAFPNNPFEYKDTDGDGMGDNLDTDADGDGTPDERDAFPLDKNETLDTDWDGTGDNADSDDDNDGINDTSDAFPKNPHEFKDSDGDGIGDNLDPDDDNDGTTDEQEMLDAISLEFTTLTAALSLMQSTLQGDLDGMNSSLRSNLDGLGSDFLDELWNVNASLADDIQDALDAITADVSDLGTTVTGDIDDLEAWLDQLLTALDTELVRTNVSLHSHMSDMDTRTEGFYQFLSKDLAGAIYQLAQVESNLSSENEDIQADIALLSELTSNLNEHSLSELSALLDSLAEDLSEFDEETANRLHEISTNISTFETSTSNDLDEIDTTLEDLEKLNGIMDDLEKLDQDIDTAKDEIDASVQDSSDEQLGRNNVNMALIALVLVLVIVILVLLFQMRKTGQETQQPKVEEEEIIMEP